MKDLALITLHGMGIPNPNYFSDLKAGLEKSLAQRWTRVSFQPVDYGTMLQRPQDKLWQDMVAAPGNDLDYTRLRKFLLFGFGDAGSLEYSAHTKKTKYIAVQGEIQNALNAALADMGNDAAKPVVIVAQSLGAQVISNYLWDAEKNNNIFGPTSDAGRPATDWLRLKTLKRLFTTGCNIPLFVAGLDQRESFAKPNDEFHWDNYYDADDVLGWPLRQLGPSFGIVDDHDINVGGIFTSWNPLSHRDYWSDRDFVRPLSEALRKLLP